MLTNEKKKKKIMKENANATMQFCCYNDVSWIQCLVAFKWNPLHVKEDFIDQLFIIKSSLSDIVVVV